jgi:CheY-like chemotaxis protein
MPVEDDYDLICKVKSLPPDRGGKTPAAALTAYARSEDSLISLSAGSQAHIPKPAEPDDPIAIVASLDDRNGRI